MWGELKQTIQQKNINEKLTIQFLKKEVIHTSFKDHRASSQPSMWGCKWFKKFKIIIKIRVSGKVWLIKEVKSERNRNKTQLFHQKEKETKQKKTKQNLIDVFFFFKKICFWKIWYKWRKIWKKMKWA